MTNSGTFRSFKPGPPTAYLSESSRHRSQPLHDGCPKIARVDLPGFGRQLTSNTVSRRTLFGNGPSERVKNASPLRPQWVWNGHTPTVDTLRLESFDLAVLGQGVQFTWENVMYKKEAVPERRLAQLLAEKLIAVMVL